MDAGHDMGVTVRQIWAQMQEEIMHEAAYAGNVGFVEMFQFMKTASANDVKKMEQYLATGEYDRAWKLLKRATGVPLKGLGKNLRDVARP